MAEKERNKKRRNTGLAFAVFLLGILVILIFYLVKRDTIITNLQETNFFDKVFGKTPEFVQNHTPGEKSENEEGTSGDSEIIIQFETEKEVPPVVTTTEKVKPVEQKTEIKTEKENVVPEVKEETKKTVETTEKTTVVSKVTYTDLSLCFIEVDSEGSINRKMIKRSVPKNDSPLTTAINLLLEGPDTSKSAEKNCINLIPSGTKLLSARVQDGVAYLSFNDAFEINGVGVEGYIGQLMQIVYTATSFSTVSSVQFLIEGQKKDYLGSEGQWIGSPLSRSSF